MARVTEVGATAAARGDVLTASRQSGLQRLQAFVPHAGRSYAARRNADLGPGNRDNVSRLSAYTRHRLVTESEIIAAVFERHTPSAAEKFVQEVAWRTYWKGWLEQRQGLWRAYLDQRDQDLAQLRSDASLAVAYGDAVAGRTGIGCFDHWARELLDTGYLHNHARMWFASIWLFTLDLPWTLGADYFYRNLLDGDPASNTLSWRWVGGLHTRGKTYLARPDNIATYTNGRFPDTPGLAMTAPPLIENLPQIGRAPLTPRARPPSGKKAVLVLHEDDLAPETADWSGLEVVAVAAIPADTSRHELADHVRCFKTEALSDGLERARNAFDAPAEDLSGSETADVIADGLEQLATSSGADVLVTLEAPVGPARTALDAIDQVMRARGAALIRVRRDWDDAFWPHATAGFFKLKTQIPSVLDQLGLMRS